MSGPFDLPHRAARCVRHARDGNAVILVITDGQREEAERLIGAAPVIVANSAECLRFLRSWMSAAFGGRRRR